MIGARNSTIQLLRDGLYRACEAYMNGALGDFGYGLVLVNYGRVMVSLLTADGLARPALVPPVVIGSLPGKVTTETKARAAAGDRPRRWQRDASGGPDRAPAKPPRCRRQPPVGGSTVSAAVGRQLNDQAERIFEKVVLPLANPTQDPAGKFIEVTVACMLWLDSTGLKRTKSDSDDLRTVCLPRPGGESAWSRRQVCRLICAEAGRVDAAVARG